jgi:outer membrane protein assembly factor BamB
MNRREFLPMLAIPVLAPGRANAKTNGQDWPQWRGPNRDGISKEIGLSSSWPAGGPKVLWTASGLGTGYGTAAIAGERIYVQGTRGRNSVVWCLNRADGKPVWHAPLGETLDQNRGPGPRGTPTVSGENLYALSENGDLACIRANDARGVWHKNILSDFHGRNPNWLISESPLVEGNMVVFMPGGPGAGIVAVDKATGRDVWTAKELSDPAGYASIIAADVHGVRTLMGFTARAAVGVRASDGKLMWRYERVANRTANCTTPVYSDGKVFYTSAYGTGCALLELSKGDSGVTAEEAYFNREMMNHHGGVVLVNGHVYGFSNAILTCMEFATGNVKWKDRSVGKGSLTYADGKLFLLGEGNRVGLAKASPASYQELGSFSIPDSGLPSWAHPVVCDGRLYIRNQATLTCYDVQGA